MSCRMTRRVVIRPALGRGPQGSVVGASQELPSRKHHSAGHPLNHVCRDAAYTSQSMAEPLTYSLFFSHRRRGGSPARRAERQTFN